MNPAPPLLAAAPEVAWRHLQWNNFYSARYGLHYIATPKVACTSLKWWFAELEGVKTQLLSAASLETLPDLVVHDTLPLTQPQCAPRTAQAFEAAAQRRDVLRFAFVRHPVARVFSAWASKVALAEPEQAQNLPPEHTQSPLRSAQDIAAAFERFVDAVIAREAALGAWSDPHWTPQTVLLQPQVLNYTGGIHPIELLPEFMRRLGDWAQSRAVHIPFALGRYNESVLPYCADWVSDSARRQIAAIYADDFAAFGYDAQALPPGHAANTPQIIDRAWAQIQTVRERNQRFAALRRQLLQQAPELQALPALREELAWRREQNGSHEAYIAQLSAQIDQFYAQIAQLDQIAQESQDQLAAILRSRSWRLTAPLRKLKPRI